MKKYTRQSIIDYFYGRETDLKEDELASMLISDEPESELDRDLYYLWNNLHVDSDDKLDTQAYSRFAERMSFHRESKKRKALRRIVLIGGLAATLALIPLLGIVASMSRQLAKPEVWIEQTAALGMTKKLVLPDGSKILLNSGSKIIYPESFQKHKRQVYVSGEAYAEVTKDPSRPFYLSVSDITVKVLGTKFNVKSFPEQSRTEVSLIEGCVSIEVMDGNEQSREYTITPGTYVSIDKKTGDVDMSNFSPELYSFWYIRNGGLFFRDQPLNEIIADLERHFDVKIVLRSEELCKMTYYASFINNETIEEVLASLSSNNSFKYTVNGRNIDIYKR